MQETNKSHHTFYLAQIIVLLGLICPSLQGQTGITSFNITSFSPPSGSYAATSPSDASGDIDPNTTYELRFGRGTDYVLNSYTINGATYDNFLQPDTLALRRTDGSEFVNIWYTLIGIDPVILILNPIADINIDVPYVNDANEIYKSNTLLAGYDNILVNEDDQAAGSIQAQIERVDAIWYTGIASCAPENAVFPILERGGNDSIKVAAITALDAQGNPSAYSNMVEIVDADWPDTGISYDDYIILRNQSADEFALPLLTISGSQTIQGVAVSLDELGISSGQVIYGYSLFAYDTNDAEHDLTDISTFPTNTLASASGLDFVAGVSAAVSSDNCLTLAQGPGGYRSGLATWLKASETDDISTSDEGASVTNWQDHWIGNNDFTTSNSAPLYRSSTSSINFNQTVDFTSADRGLTTANNSDFNSNGTFYERKSISLAFRTSSDISTRQVLFEQGGSDRGINLCIRNNSLYAHAWNTPNDGVGAPWNTTDNTISTSIITNKEYTLTIELNGNNSNSGDFTAYLNGQNFGTISAVGLLYSDTDDITFGRSGGTTRYDDGTNSSANSFTGEVSELAYTNEPSSFTNTERGKTESYFALKYGITLDQSTPINYLNSQGITIFNTTNSSSLGGYLEYNNDIAGIGRDDNSEFEQQKSKSENDGAIITIDHAGAFESNNSWLIWGNDGEAITNTENVDVPSIIDERMERVWRVSETNETSETNITFDLDELSISGDPLDSDYSLLIAANSSDGSFTSASVISGGTVSANTVTFNNINLSHGEYFTLGTGYINCSPAGVDSSLSLWLKADLGPNNTSGEVTDWNDLASSNHATGSSGTSPSFSSNSINFNPALDFDGASDVLTANGGFHSPAYYIVVVPDDNLTSSSSVQVPLGWDDSSVSTTTSLGGFFFGNAYSGVSDIIGHIVGTGATSYTSFEDNSSKTITAGVPLIFGTIDNASSSPTNSLTFQNGSQITNTAAGTLLSVSNEEYALGRFETPNGSSLNNFFDGKIAEVISYSTRPTLVQDDQITSYLAIKYGVTLAHNYLSSSAAVVWDITANSSYNNDIAGIGRDDNACLTQRQSKSENSDAIVTISLGEIAATNAANNNSFSTDESFLVWGNNNGSRTQANANTSDLPGNLTERMSRVWFVEETGSVEGVTVSFDLSGLGYTPIASNFQLIVSASSTMAAGDTYTGGTLEGNTITFKDIDFTNGDFFTLGTNVANNGPGGVTEDLALWLKADVGTSTDEHGEDITEWQDFSSNNRHADLTDLGGGLPVEPTFSTNEFNFNPSIQLYDPNSTNATFLETGNGNNISEDLTVVVVFKTGQSGGSTNNFEAAPTILGAGDSGGTNDYGLGISEGRLHFNASSNSGLNARSPSGTLYNNLKPHIATGIRVRANTSGSIQLYANSNNIASGTSTDTSLSGAGAFGIGNHDDGNLTSHFNGHVAEAIVFADDLTNTERAKVESYLAIKYGITRETTDSYLASDGDEIFNYSTNVGYISGIAGIGRDDNSGLVQKQSKSQENDAIVTISVNSFDSDDSFLLWSNNNAPIEDEENTEYNPGQVKGRLNREWKVQETGNMGNVNLTFDLSEISGTEGIGTNNLSLLRLMVDADGDFSSETTLYDPSSTDAVNKTVHSAWTLIPKCTLRWGLKSKAHYR